MPTLAVGGCSFSDYRYDIVPYGPKVAQHFDYEYIHEAACAGSNYRMWRRLTQHIIADKLVAGDIVLLQYTLIDRKESWTPVVHPNTNPKESITELYSTGSIIRLTPHTEQFAIGKRERELSRCHNYFSNHQFNLECFWAQHHQFAALCATRGITLRYLNTDYDREHRVQDIDAQHVLQQPTWRLDHSHLNQVGHDICTSLIIDHLAPAIDSN